MGLGPVGQAAWFQGCLCALWATESVGQRSLTGGPLADYSLHLCFAWPAQNVCVCVCFKLELVDIIKKSGESCNVK